MPDMGFRPAILSAWRSRMMFQVLPDRVEPAVSVEMVDSLSHMPGVKKCPTQVRWKVDR